jgi:hypothetical protein
VQPIEIAWIGQHDLWQRTALHLAERHFKPHVTALVDIAKRFAVFQITQTD